MWKIVQERWKSGQPITKSEVRIQCMKRFTEGDFFVNILDKSGNTNNFYVFLKDKIFNFLYYMYFDLQILHIRKNKESKNFNLINVLHLLTLWKLDCKQKARFLYFKLLFIWQK